MVVLRRTWIVEVDDWAGTGSRYSWTMNETMDDGGGIEPSVAVREFSLAQNQMGLITN